MGKKRPAANAGGLKVVDATYRIGNAKMREEVWQDSMGRVVRYNLAFIDHHRCAKDNGRILGYDSAHGYHHRHWMGTVESIEFPGYEALVTRFCEEVAELCGKGKV